MLDGREPVEVTEYEYDAAGRLIRAVTTRESEWLPEDRAEALALAAYRASLCPSGCGQPVGESTSHYEDGPEYHAKATTCRACAALAEAQRAEAEHADGTARLWHVTRTPRR